MHADLIRHSQRAKHIVKVNLQSPDYNNNNGLHSDKVKRAEIKLAAFFSEHNIAFYTADHLIPLLKNICIDSKIVHDLSLGRKKCTNVVKNVIARRETEKIIDILQTRRFSILIDESTDISDLKIMCVLVQFFSPDDKVKTQLLDLISLNATDCSANKIYESFKEVLNKKQIPIKNIFGMASDNASVMIGCNNSFFSRLQSEIPGVVMLNCICHSSAIIASKACEKLPQSCESLIRGIATYISGSAKRCAILTEFQEFFNVEKNKILKLSNTRWLVLQHCVIRVLGNDKELINRKLSIQLRLREEHL
ncbi:SCAN domain-containing protein 3-like [Polyergus mexicanus]|uniref:SCAN domain-containing protein 3-like n=1 Tax=Polyergus mexicanus TaxID=615972 RepID=UPI0038B44F08